jgi:hypothetical protein
MKIALYIDDGREQIVLTPESDTEKAILGKMHDGSRVMSIYKGEFYECRGGWTRHSANPAATFIVLDRTNTPSTPCPGPAGGVSSPNQQGEGA